MKMQKITRLVTLNLGLLIMVWLTAGAGVAVAEVFMPKTSIPSGGSSHSIHFNVTDVGTLTVRVKLRIDTILGANVAGQSRYMAELVRFRNGQDEQLSPRVTASQVVAGAFEEVTLTKNISNCGETGLYRIKLTNTSTDNPQKGEAEFPAFNPPSREVRNLDMQGTTADIDKGTGTERNIGTFSKLGKLELKAKWHVPGIIPTYAKLTILLLRSDGTTANPTPRVYSSYHHVEGTNKFNITYQMKDSDVTPEMVAKGQWKLKITNNSDHRIEGFNIEKGSDANPFVPNFKSTFTSLCGQ